jgi:hypothetical protein
MSVCLLYLPLKVMATSSWNDENFILASDIAYSVLLQVCWMAVIVFSPVQQLTRRLGFVVLGVLTLVALSEISKLNLHQYLKPTRVSDFLEYRVSVLGSKYILHK